MLRLIHKMDLPRTSEFLTRDESALARSLGLLVSKGVVSKFDDGQEPVYAIAPGAGRSAAYYRNGMIHFFVNGAIADLALAGIRDDAAAPKAEQFREMALSIRDLFKFEFFFENSEKFLSSLNKDLEIRAPGWQSALQARESGVRKLLRSMSPILGHGTLRPFLEAYALIGEILANDASGSASTSGDLVAAAFKLGKQRLRQQRIQCEESLSTNYFENAVNIAAHRGLLDAGDDVRSKRIAFRDELLGLVYRAKLLASIAESQLLDQRRE
jgi:glycerol-3-phosphate O-acyltransferase